MLKSVHIYEYRSCKDVVLSDIRSILVLIGRNGAGKSNILKAIEWAALAASGNESKKDTTPFDFKQGKVSFEFVIESNLYLYTLESEKEFLLKDGETVQKTMMVESLSLSQDGNWIPLFNRSGEKLSLSAYFGPGLASTLNVSDTLPSLVALQSFLQQDHAFRAIAEKIARFFSSVKYYPLQAFEGKEEGLSSLAVEDKEYKTWVSNKFQGDGESSNLIYKILHLYLTQREKFEELKSLLGENGLGLIHNIVVRSFSPGGDEKKNRLTDSFYFHFTSFYPTQDLEKSVRFNDLSYGTKRIISLLVSILFDSSSVSLIEQPEDGIHAGLVHKLAGLLESYAEGAQFVIATHSITILNHTNPEDVRIVTMSDAVTQAVALDERQVGAAKKYLEQDGTFSEFLDMIKED
jgi:AAA15 family ATPase/GTPase